MSRNIVRAESNLQAGEYVGEVGAAVDVRLTGPEEVEVGAVDEEDATRHWAGGSGAGVGRGVRLLHSGVQG